LKNNETSASDGSGGFRRRTWLGLGGVIILSLTLNLVGIRWSLPNVRTWANDTIAGLPTIQQQPLLFKTWKYKYPRMQFLINSAAYVPLLRYWKEHPVQVEQPDGRKTQTVLDLERFSTLVLTACVITALMGVGTAWAVFLTARRIFRNDAAAFLAGCGTACVHEFVFYCHTGNVDVGAAFWFAWSLYFIVKVIEFHRWRDYLASAALGALAVCTKDPTIGFLAGAGCAVVISLYRQARNEGRSAIRSLLAVFSPKPMAALFLFVLLFMWINNIITDPAGYRERMAYWQGGDIRPWQYPVNFRTFFWRLPTDSFKDCYFAMGWPLLGLTMIASVYFLICQRGRWFLCAAPILGFYAVVILTIRFTAPRFFIPGFGGLAILAGGGAALWLGKSGIPKVLRYAPIVFIYGATFLYALGIGLEMEQDTRQRAVRWFEANVDRRVFAGAMIKRWYAPNLGSVGFSRYGYPWSPQAGRQDPKNYPEYLITGTSWQVPDEDKVFYQDLLDGKYPYQRVMVFQQQMFYPNKTAFGFAGWPEGRMRQISLPVAVWKRTSE
jgi:hypothetical protein